MLSYLFALLPVGIWTYLLLGRGRFWQVRAHLPKAAGPPDRSERRVVAVIPARNEADIIAGSLESLLRQRSLPPIPIVVVDDNSTDGTAIEVQNTAARFNAAGRVADQVMVIAGQPLPPGWTGKLWALNQGIAAALSLQPEYLLLTDADIRHDEYSIARLVQIAEATRSDFASYMVKLATETMGERLLIPAFVYFFFALYPPSFVASPRSAIAAAAGGCILIKPGALERAGGIAAIRDQMIDDCALADRVKQSGGSIWLGLTEESRSSRSYGSFAGVGRMIARSAFFQLQHSYALLVLTLAALSVTYLLPLVLLTRRRPVPVASGLISYAIMTGTYAPTVRFYRQPILAALCLPLIAIFYGGATVFSAWQYARGKGGAWKGRAQDSGKAAIGPQLLFRLLRPDESGRQQKNLADWGSQSASI